MWKLVTLGISLFILALAAFPKNSMAVYAVIDLSQRSSYDLDGEVAQVESANTDNSSHSATPLLVASEEALKIYIETAKKNDEHIHDIVVTENTVEMHYKEIGRFLALVPITLTIRAVAHADGNVVVSYPWYASLTLDKKKELETELGVAVSSTLKALRGGTAVSESGKFTAIEAGAVAVQMHGIFVASIKAQERVATTSK